MEKQMRKLKQYRTKEEEVRNSEKMDHCPQPLPPPTGRYINISRAISSYISIMNPDINIRIQPGKEEREPRKGRTWIQTEETKNKWKQNPSQLLTATDAFSLHFVRAFIGWLAVRFVSLTSHPLPQTHTHTVTSFYRWKRWPLYIIRFLQN